jgi:uncharacterized protein (TIGR02452 family)
MNNMRRKTIAQDTVRILELGQYSTPSGRQVDLRSALADCLNGTQCYDPDSLRNTREQVLKQPVRFSETDFDVINETTLQGAARLAAKPAERRIAVLNFASAKNPGGGFLGGAHAQEESLARSSGLYHSLLQCRSYYEYHRSHSSCVYSDRMIYSPGCPIFRADDGALLEEPHVVDFITSPAPNAGVIREREPEMAGDMANVLRERGSKVLALASFHGCDALVLGAWGCGVFRNDPGMVAQTFFELLSREGRFYGRFQKVLFSVLDSSASGATYRAFAERFVNC